MELNDKMKDLFNTHGVSDSFHLITKTTERSVPIRLYEVGGCTFLSHGERIEKIDDGTVKNLYMDKTGYEAKENLLYLDEYFDQSYDESEKLRYSLTYVNRLSEQLSKDFKGEAFEIILSIENGAYTCRFYKVRKNERFYLYDDLETCKNEAVLVMNIK